MKKFLVIVGLFFIAAGVYTVITGKFVPLQDAKVTISSPGIKKPPPVTSPEVTLPQKLIIPKLGIAAAVEYVGMDEKGNMDVPRNDNNVAWYELGFKPGAAGNSVMAGHLDTRTGAPAIFYQLDSLEKGDRIQIIGTDGSTKEFVVTHKQTYPYNAFPLVEVFGTSDKPRLNLITCEGRYNSSERNYSHRTVVYSELTQ